MYKKIKSLYEAGSLSLTGVANAVVKDWITAEQYEAITGETYSE